MFGMGDRSSDAACAAEADSATRGLVRDAPRPDPPRSVAPTGAEET